MGGPPERQRLVACGKHTLYEGGIRACAFATWPGQIPPGTVTREPLHAVDWYPTLLKLAGASSEQGRSLDGLDIWPVITQGGRSPHDAILICGSTPTRAAVRSGDWKLVPSSTENEFAGKLARREGVLTGEAGPMQLFDLKHDLGEKNDLAASHPGKVKELREKLGALLRGAVPSGSETEEPKP